jgi:hypothetical protein
MVPQPARLPFASKNYAGPDTPVGVCVRFADSVVQ